MSVSDICPYCGDGPDSIGTLNHIECVEALAAQLAHRERIIAHLIAEEHLTPHGREARRKWLDENCEAAP